MKKLGLILLVSLLIAPLAAQAQIYKWKDKDGTVRYSDTPPPSNIPHESLGGRKPAAAQPAQEAPKDEAKAAVKETAPSEPPKETPEQLKEKQRVEQENKKIRQQNCTAARANLQTYTQGGRISRMSESGEREFLDDAALAQGAEQARKDIAENCD